MAEDSASTTRKWTSHSEAETERIGAELVTVYGAGRTLLLFGDLGAGKTVLARGLAVALGIDRAEIQSPTYTLIHEHEGTRGRLVHVDLYRLEPHEVGGLGLEELIDGPGIKAVEWADRLPALPPNAVHVYIRSCGEGRREILATLDPPA